MFVFILFVGDNLAFGYPNYSNPNTSNDWWWWLEDSARSNSTFILVMVKVIVWDLKGYGVLRHKV